MTQGKYESLSINFIHPAKIGSWLLKNKRYWENNHTNIEELM